MIPDRVHCSRRETVGTMAALKLKMIEAGIFLLWYSHLISDHTTVIHHHLFYLLSVFSARTILSVAVRAIPRWFAKSTSFQVKMFIRGIVRLLLGLSLHAKSEP